MKNETYIFQGYFVYILEYMFKKSKASNAHRDKCVSLIVEFAEDFIAKEIRICVQST